MFGLFKKDTKLQKLEKKHKKLLEEAYKLSKSNRQLSDEKTAEAEAVLKEMENLQS